jgi:hypothetical protein
MEPRKTEPKKTPEQRKDERKSRFQIVKLEARIAPCNPHLNPQGKAVGENCRHDF